MLVHNQEDYEGARPYVERALAYRSFADALQGGSEMLGPMNREEAAEREAQRQRELDLERQRAEVQSRAARRLAAAAGLLLVVLIVAVVAGVWAIWAQGAAEDQADTAQSLALAAASQAVGDENAMRALLLAVEAGRTRETALAFDALNQPYLSVLVRPRYTLTHEGSVNEARWNRDESLILTSSDDGTAKVWDAESGNLVFTLRGKSNSLAVARWNMDESRILFASGESVRVYYTQMDELLEAACQYATRNLTWSEWQLYLPGRRYRQSCPNLPPHPSVPAEQLSTGN